MHERAIIDEIVNRVYAKLTATPDQAVLDKKRILLLARKPSDLLGQYCHDEQLALYWQVDCYFADDLEKLEFNDLPLGDKVIVFDLTIEDLAQVASAIPLTGYARTLVKALLNGSKIEIDQGGMELSCYENISPYSYYNLLCSKIRFLEKCGVVFTCLEQDCSLDLCQADAIANTEQVYMASDGSRPAYIWDRRVLTEQDLVRLLGEGHKVIALPQRTILTDLAREYVAKHGIKLMSED